MEQISDKAYTDQCKKQADDSILYCWQGFGNSVVIISRNEDKFFAVVYLNSELLRKKRLLMQNSAYMNCKLMRIRTDLFLPE